MAVHHQAAVCSMSGKPRLSRPFSGLTPVLTIVYHELGSPCGDTTAMSVRSSSRSVDSGSISRPVSGVALSSLNSFYSGESPIEIGSHFFQFHPLPHIFTQRRVESRRILLPTTFRARRACRSLPRPSCCAALVQPSRLTPFCRASSSP